jgi:hypothetical protein
MKHELGSTDDLSFILDEALHSFQVQNKLTKPSSKIHAKLFILVSKTTRSEGLLASFNFKAVKYLADTHYDIFIMHDCDSAVLYEALNL